MLLDRDELSIRLCDFGLATRLGDGEQHKTIAGSPFFMAPELFSREGYSTNADIWGLGCVLISLLLDSCSRRELGLDCVLGLKGENKIDNVCKVILEAGYSPQLVDFIRKCLIFVPAERPSAEELLSSGWILSDGPSI